MRRYILIKGNKLTVCTESFGQEIIPSFIPLFTLIKNNTKLQLNIRPFAVAQYDIPAELSIKEQVVYLLTCIGHNQTDVVTDMELLIDDFINSDERLDGETVFASNGCLPKKSMQTNKEEVTAYRHSC